MALEDQHNNIDPNESNHAAPIEESPGGSPVPMKERPGLQALCWIGGIAAGFVTFVAFIALVPSRARGATAAAHAQWTLWRNGPRSVARVQAGCDLPTADHEPDVQLRPTREQDVSRPHDATAHEGPGVEEDSTF